MPLNKETKPNQTLALFSFVDLFDPAFPEDINFYQCHIWTLQIGSSDT